MRIGELARQSGVPATALRFWEQAGLLPSPRRISGRREYGPDALDRVSLLLLAKTCGFTVQETRRLFGPGLDGQPPSARWETLAQLKLAEMERVERLLDRMRAALDTVRRCRCVDLEACAAEARRALPAETAQSGPRRTRGGQGKAHAETASVGRRKIL
jgi:MerR family redox-sensitive transcriptional activator SoxR